MNELKDLLKNIEMKIKYEKLALSEDDPKECCAANHRGAIRAYEIVKDIVTAKLQKVK